MINYMKNKLTNLYFSNKQLTEKDLVKSQRKLIFSDVTAQMINVMTTGTFFMGYLTYLGISKQNSAIIAAMPLLGSLLMLFSPYFFERMKHRKLLICLCCFIFRFSVSTVGFIPYFTGKHNLQVLLLITIYGLGFFTAGFVTPGLNNWNLDVAPEEKRGRYLALKSIVSLISVSLLTLFLGRLLDYYKMQDKLMIGFNIMFGLSMILSVVDFVILSNINEPCENRVRVNYKIKQLILEPLTNKQFRKFIIFLCLWQFAIQISSSFTSIFMLTSLGLSYSYISTVNVITNIASILLYYVWGYLADKTTWNLVLKLSSFLIALCYLGWSLVTPDNSEILVVFIQIVLASSSGAFSMANSNLQYNLSPAVGKTTYLGAASAMSYVISFIGTLLGSALYGFVQKANFRILYAFTDNIQILFVLTSILLISALCILPGQNRALHHNKLT